MAFVCKQCPKCGSKNSAKIVYGLPDYQLYERFQAGKIMLGGCLVFGDNAEYFCRDCENKWNKKQAIDAAYSKITTIKASVGGYWGDNYDVEIDIVHLIVTWKRSGNGVEVKETRKRIRESTKDHFLEQLKHTDLLNWKAKYLDMEICDGTSWSIEIITDAKNTRKYGINKFPEEWDPFCQLIAKTAAQKFQ